MSKGALRKGWCPGVLRPMPSGDGLLVRVRISAGEVSHAVARTLASLAQSHGNGAIDLSRRGNLQLRGVREASLPELTAALAEHGLVDASPEGEAVRNVLVSPLAGIDPACADGRGTARELEDRLRNETPLHALPAKFGFAVDGGGAWPLGETEADVTLFAQGRDWRVRLNGSGEVSQVICKTSAVDALASLAVAFAATGHGRMRDWVSQSGAGAVFAAAGLAPDPGWLCKREPTVRPKPGPVPAGSAVAVGVAFGSMQAEQLAGLAQAAGPDTTLRLTPWRMIIVPAAGETAATQILHQAGTLGFVTSPDDPRSRIEACTGAPGCANASTATRADAARLALLLGPQMKPGGPLLHVSGCAKSCAFSGPAPITLVGRNGRYDLIRNGTAAGRPDRTGLAPGEVPAAIQSESTMT